MHFVLYVQIGGLVAPIFTYAYEWDASEGQSFYEYIRGCVCWIEFKGAV